jgi:hypothetical protein
MKKVNPSDLQAAINDAEKGVAFPHLKKLFEVVADSEWAKSQGISAWVVSDRYKVFKLTSLTKPRSIRTSRWKDRSIKMPVTLDMALAKIQQAIKDSPLGGDTVLVLSLTGSGLPDVNVTDLQLVKDDDGAVMEVRAILPDSLDDEDEEEPMSLLTVVVSKDMGVKETIALGNAIGEPAYDRYQMANHQDVLFYIPVDNVERVKAILEKRDEVESYHFGEITI